MALANYTDLQSAVLAWAVRTGDTESTARVPDFISLFEAYANRKIRIRQNLTTATLSLTGGTSSVALPTGFLEEVELNYADFDDRLSRAPYDDIDRSRNSLTGQGRPQNYCIASTILFERAADVTYSLSLRYYAKWDIASDTTNWLLTNAPDAYLFGAVAEIGMFMRDDQLHGMALGKRDAAVAALLAADSRNKSRTLQVDPALQSRGQFDYRTG